jgi:hypothetical protein
MGKKKVIAREDQEASDDFCVICAEIIVWRAVGECNHTVCHECSLRLRALYKKNECALWYRHLTLANHLYQVLFSQKIPARTRILWPTAQTPQ